MLEASAPIAFIATANLDRARAFYAETLGLPLLADDDFSPVFDPCGVPLRVQKVRELHPQPFTALGWQVANAAGTVASLRARGVAFSATPFCSKMHTTSGMRRMARASRGSRIQMATCSP